MNDSASTPYSIEKPASDRPLEAYAVGRIYQLEAQVEDQKSLITQLEKTIDHYDNDQCKLMDILRPTITLTQSGDMRKLNLAQAASIYCLYDRDAYLKLVKHFDLWKADYIARMQEYENEVLNGTKTDLNAEERKEVKADYEAKSKSEGDDNNAS